MKKQDIFLNLNKIRDAERPFNKVVMTHDLTVRQREELKELIKEANEKEQQDETGSFMCEGLVSQITYVGNKV